MCAALGPFSESAVGQQLDAALAEPVAYHGCSYVRVGGMLCLFFRDQRPTNFEEVSACDLDGFGRYFRAALSGGVYLPPSQFEAVFLSSALTTAHVERAVSGISSALVAAHC